MTSKKAKPLYFRLVSDEVRDNCVKALFMAQQSSEEVLEVTIQPAKRKRSLSQNRLYWLWVNQWSEHWGWTEQYTHHFFKYKFLAIVFYRDDAKYAEACDAVKVIKSIDEGLYKSIAANVVRQTSTTDANTAQMTEYLDKIERYCYSKGVMLKIPDELQWIRGGE